VLVNAQHSRAVTGLFLAELAAQAMAEIAFHGGRSYPFPPAQPAAVHSIQMLLEDGGPERLAGTLISQDSRQGLPELLTAVQAPPPLGFYSQQAVPLPEVLMPHQAPVYSPASLAVALTMRT
jgi:hypothetical protein